MMNQNTLIAMSYPSSFWVWMNLSTSISNNSSHPPTFCSIWCKPGMRAFGQTIQTDKLVQLVVESAASETILIIMCPFILTKCCSCHSNKDIWLWLPRILSNVLRLRIPMHVLSIELLGFTWFSSILCHSDILVNWVHLLIYGMSALSQCS